jgi:hypothetical protein
MENSSLKIEGAAAKRGRLKSGEDWGGVQEELLWTHL